MALPPMTMADLQRTFLAHRTDPEQALGEVEFMMGVADTPYEHTR